MIRNYFKIAFRNLAANKIYSAINIAGLTIGLTSCLLIATIVINEYSYDRQWSKADEIFRIIHTSVETGEREAFTYSALGPELKRQFPEVISYCRMSPGKMSFRIGEGNSEVMINSLRAEETVWDFLDLQVLQGTPQTHEAGYSNLVISQKIKDQYFENTDPIGKVIGDEYVITGIIDNLPTNTHLRAEVLIVESSDDFQNEFSTTGGRSNTAQYLLLRPGTSPEAFAVKVNKWYDEIMEEQFSDGVYSFQSIKDIYLKSDFVGYQQIKGNLTNVRILTGVALLLLLVACINFINLNTARALTRIKETGVRKVIGAGRTALIFQFLTESLLFFIISFLSGLLLYQMALPYLESFMGYPLTLAITSNFALLFVTVGLIFIVSILTGIYPALLLSRPKPVAILNNSFNLNKGSEVFRKSLVVLQFVITIGIIVATLAVHGQLQYLNQKDLGFNKNNLIQLNFNMGGERGVAFKRAIKDIPGVEEASITSWSPASITGGSSTATFPNPNSKGNNITINYIHADADLLSTLEVEVIEGQGLKTFFNENKFSSDSLGERKEKINSPIVLTKFTAEQLGIEELYKPNAIYGTPVGIVENFHNESLRKPLAPTIFSAVDWSHGGRGLLIRLRPGDQQNILSSIEQEFKSFFPDSIFDISWIEDELAKEYRAEKKLQNILWIFSILIVFLSCMGLFGLITFTIQTRMKEISIRKVLGSSVFQILTLLSKGTLQLILLASLIAVPISWYGIQQWLNKFPYRIEPHWEMFALGIFMALFIALFTVTIQTYKAAISNPAENLRTE